jgi:hypothetical protein
MGEGKDVRHHKIRQIDKTYLKQRKSHNVHPNQLRKDGGIPKMTGQWS